MKKNFIWSLSILLIGFSAIAQNNFINYLPKDLPNDLSFGIHPNYRVAVKKEKLNEAKLISDLITDYPALWISNYFTVEISATCNGKAKKAISISPQLSKDQKDILNTSDEATNIVVDINYNYKDPAFKSVENNKIHISMMVVPDTEAEFIGGEKQMTNYLKENIINKIKFSTPKQFQHALISFVVNEQGEITNTKIRETSGDLKTDKLMLDLIGKMPKWKAAENAKGLKLKQEFEFNIGRYGC